MKKRVLSLSIATALVESYPSAHGLAPPRAGYLQFGNTGWGHTLLVPYFEDRGVPVQYRGAYSTNAVYDFREFLI